METLNHLGVKSKEAGAGAMALGEILSPKPALLSGRRFSQQLSRVGKAVEAPMFMGPEAPWGLLGPTSSRNN